MYVMSWVGIGTVISLVINVPILLQSLANSLADINVAHLPLGFHFSLLAALDDGVATSSPSCLVNLYACDWWKHSMEPAPGEILGLDTLNECLNMHRQYIVITDSSPTNIQPANDGLNSKPNC